MLAFGDLAWVPFIYSLQVPLPYHIILPRYHQGLKYHTIQCSDSLASDSVLLYNIPRQCTSIYYVYHYTDYLSIYHHLRTSAYDTLSNPPCRTPNPSIYPSISCRLVIWSTTTPPSHCGRWCWWWSCICRDTTFSDQQIQRKMRFEEIRRILPCATSGTPIL